MDLASRVKLFLKANNIRADKRQGQHFLIDEKALDKIIGASNIKPDETIVEIGPGFGIMTEKLLHKAGRVVAVEKDPRMIAALAKYLPDRGNLTLINEDVLKADFRKIGKYSIVANLPYYITSPILRAFLTLPNKPRRMVVTIQKEVADRIASDPPDSVLAFSVRYFAEPRELFTIPKDSFLPPPDVESAVLELKIREKPHFKADEKKLFRIVKAAFGERRKQLLNSLSGGLRIERSEVRTGLAAAGIDAARRAQELSMNEWEKLYKEISDKISS